MSDIRKKAVAGLKSGDTFSVSRTFSEQDMIRFAEISRDYNPVHFDERFAKAKKFDRRICHGLLITGLLTEIGGQMGWLASGMNLRFLRPVYFGDTVRCDFTITAVDERGRAEAKVVFLNGDGQAVSEAVLTGILPGENEKRIMHDMLAEGDPTNRAASSIPAAPQRTEKA
ncbi:MAG: MaoC family dehydratase [Desulfocapsaceae bacterium]|nr:MaoC family dehydratase [Desulfocapsaceae bacterium]